MKKAFIYTLLLLIPLITVSCHKDLNVQQKGGISTNEAWQTGDDAEAAMYGMMSTFRAAFATNFVYWGEYRTGLWGPGLSTQPARDNVYANTIDAANAYTDWTNLYTTINSANLILKYTPGLPFNSEQDRNTVLGSALFVRAFCYYWIVRIWGDAPLCLDGFESDNQENLYPYREPKANIFATIEQDLANAAGYLQGVSRTPNLPTAEAVNTLQTDLYLWLYKVENDQTALAKARKACDAVYGKKTLLADYASIFNVDNKLNAEEIFLWSMIKEEKEGGFQSDWLVPIQYMTAKYIENPVKAGSHQQWVFITDTYKDILNEVPGDTRRVATYDIFYDPEASTTHQWINKFAGTWENEIRVFNSDIIVYRYADILLFDAEIDCYENNPDGAIESVNQLVQRAYGVSDYYEKGQSAEAVLDIILKERIKEFCGEGKTWWDYIRFGVVFDRVPALAGKENNKNILLWPLSQTSLNDNQNLKQTEIEY